MCEVFHTPAYDDVISLNNKCCDAHALRGKNVEKQYMKVTFDIFSRTLLEADVNASIDRLGEINSATLIQIV